ncbi:MAG: D-alanyl-D-alanine carboxypeptidase [Gillisia sp.]
MRYKTLALLLLLISFLLGSCSGLRIHHQLKKGLQDEVFANSFTGVAFFDLQKNRMLYQKNAQKYFTPASNMKLFSFYAGLKFLGDSIEGIYYRETHDSLIFTGTGDPSFLNHKLQVSTVYNFLGKTSTPLYYQPKKFYDENFGPGWAWDDYNYAFSAERSSFPIYGNLVEITFPVSSEVRILPRIFQKSLRKSQDTLLPPGRENDTNIFYYPPSTDRVSKKRYIPFKYSPELFVQLLSDTLHKPVKLLDRTSHSRLTTPIYSIPTDSLYKTMLQESDNFMAEQLLYMVSQKISDTLTASETIDFLKNDIFKELPQEPVWVDGSGLSRYNMVTPEDLVFLLKKIHKEIPEKRLFELLPVGGKSGTLKNAFKEEPPFIFAKTGSLSNNYSLSGYLKTRKGKIILFSFMNNHFVIPSSEIKAAMEKILLDIYHKN